MRDGLGVRAERGGVEIAVVGGLLLDPVLGVRATSLGISDGRIVSIGRAGNPDTMDGIEVVLDTGTAVFDARGLIVTPGGIDTHVHLLSPQVCDAALAGGLTTLVTQEWGPVWNLGPNPPEAMAMMWAAFDAIPLNFAMLVRGLVGAPGAGRARARARRRRAQDPRGRQRGARADPLRARGRRRHDVQLAIHTDGLNEALQRRGHLRRVRRPHGARLHIEGVGGGHAPDLLELAGRDRVLTSSTSPTVPFGVDRGRAPGDGHCGAPARTGGARRRRRDPSPPGARVDDGRRVGAARSRRDPHAELRLAGHGPDRRGRAPRVPVRRRDEGRSRGGARPGRQRAGAALPRQGDDQPGDRARPRAHVGSLEVGKLADAGDVGPGALRGPPRARS